MEKGRALRFLLANWEGGGQTPPFRTLARQLAARGHAVTVISDICNASDFAMPGVRFVAWRRAPNRPDRTAASDPIRDWDVPDPATAFRRMLDHLLTGPALAYAEDVIDELRREPVDLVVASEMLLGVAAACEAQAQPFAMLNVNVSIFPIPGLPPLGPGLLPATDEASRAQHVAIARELEATFDQGLPALNAARRQLGLEPLAHVADQVAVADAVLMGTGRAFDFAPDTLPSKLHYVGPLLDLPVWAEGLPDAAADATPTVAVCLSTTFQNQGPTLQRIMDAIERLPVRGVATLGPALDRADFRPPANVDLRAGADHDALMRRSAAVVTHGGHGTVMRALVRGKPLLVIPHGRDQADNAVRVVARGAGLMLPPDARAEAIAAALRRLLDDASFAESARRLGDAVAAEMAASPLLPMLERLARGALAGGA